MILGLSAGISLASCSEPAAQKGGAPKGSPLMVEATIVQPKSMENAIQTSGSLLPGEEVMIKAEQSGRILEISFQEGKAVQKGQMLFHIDDREFQAQKQTLKVQLSLAKTQHDRNAELLKMEALSQEQYDASLNKLEELKSEMAVIDAKIDKCQIKAPFSGKAGLRYISPGSYVNAGDNLGGLVQLNPMKLEFEVPEIYASEVKPGLEIKFKIAQSKKEYTGKVYASEQGLNMQSRNLKVRALVENKSEALVPGTFAEVVLELENINEALMIPAEAVVPELNGQKIWVLRSGKVKDIPVQIGKRTSTSVQISEGILAGDTVLTTGLLQVRPGQEVKITNWVKSE